MDDNKKISSAYIDMWVKKNLGVEEYTLDDLKNFRKVVIDGRECTDYIEDIKLFGELQSIEFMFCNMSRSELESLAELDLYGMVFNGCSFSDDSLIGNLKVKSLSIIGCKNVFCDFVYKMTSLEKLALIGVSGNVDFSLINALTNLVYLRVNNCSVINANLLNLKNLVELHVNGTNIIYLDFVNNLDSLTLLSISKSHSGANAELIESIKDKVRVVFDNLVAEE